MNTHTIHRISALAALVALLGAAAATAHAEQVQARVISSSPVTDVNGGTVYDVTYEFAGRRYMTRTSTPPGAGIWVEANDYGVTEPAPRAAEMAPPPSPASAAQPWAHIVPEPGVVVSGGSAAAPAAVYVPPGYAQPVPIHGGNDPAPAYYPPVYYPPTYYPMSGYNPRPAIAWPPIGISLGIGYSRGWGGGWGSGLGIGWRGGW
jgi:hypothetical protein